MLPIKLLLVKWFKDPLQWSKNLLENAVDARATDIKLILKMPEKLAK
jgi:hypothetical protein